MLLLILGLVIIIVLTVFAYKTAKEYDRNAVGWALITFAAGFGVQIILPFLAVFIIAAAMFLNGSTPEKMQRVIPATTISIICIVLSVAPGILILRHLSKLPEEQAFIPPPTPPTNFN